MIIEEHKSVSISRTFSLTEKEYNEILEYANQERDPDDGKFTHIKSVSFTVLGDNIRDNIHWDVSVRTKQGIPR